MYKINTKRDLKRELALLMIDGKARRIGEIYDTIIPMKSRKIDFSSGTIVQYLLSLNCTRLEKRTEKGMSLWQLKPPAKVGV